MNELYFYLGCITGGFITGVTVSIFGEWVNNTDRSISFLKFYIKEIKKMME